MAKRSREDSPPGSTADSSPSPVPDPSTTSIPTSLAASGAPHSAKQIKTLRRQHTAMKCSLPPHHDTISFSTFEDFEVHYSQFHCNRCSNCRRNFPTEHFLLLHIGENHDPLNEARRAKGEKTVLSQIIDWAEHGG